MHRVDVNHIWQLLLVALGIYVWAHGLVLGPQHTFGRTFLWTSAALCVAAAAAWFGAEAIIVG